MSYSCVVPTANTILPKRHVRSTICKDTVPVHVLSNYVSLVGSMFHVPCSMFHPAYCSFSQCHHYWYHDNKLLFQRLIWFLSWCMESWWNDWQVFYKILTGQKQQKITNSIHFITYFELTYSDDWRLAAGGPEFRESHVQHQRWGESPDNHEISDVDSFIHSEWCPVHAAVITFLPSFYKVRSL